MKEPTSSALPNLSFQEVEHDSADYLRAVALRSEILRKPLGLKFTPEYLKAEADQMHVVGMTEKRSVIATASLVVTEPEVVKMQQVAVALDYQNRGLGQQLVAFAERVASERGVTIIFCHSRDEVIPFYERAGYRAVGEIFEEIGIAHQRMEKVLTKVAD